MYIRMWGARRESAVRDQANRAFYLYVIARAAALPGSRMESRGGLRVCFPDVGGPGKVRWRGSNRGNTHRTPAERCEYFDYFVYFTYNV